MERHVIESEDDCECWCEPTMIPVKEPDGEIAWVIAHREPDQTPEQEADRASKIFEAIDSLAAE